MSGAYAGWGIAKIAKANNLKAWNESLFFATNVVVSIITLYLAALKPGRLYSLYVYQYSASQLTKHVASWAW
jgi:hypothetical protein